LQELFEGNKALFKNLYAYENWNFEEKYPVIKISWSGDFRTLESTKIQAYDILRSNQERLKINCEFPNNPSSCLRELIQQAYKKYNKEVVVLIDEYDKPILDNIDNLEVAKETREFIKGFYSVLKDNISFIQLFL
jgi:ABC-type long-subunit fatty acid transport system fused permease/ATPase subunit